MITNKIISVIISIIAIIVVPVQWISTYVLGLLVSLTFGLLLIPLSLIWAILFFAPLLGLSYIYERVVILRPFISIIGIPLAVLGDTYVSVVPSMGEWDSKYVKLVHCQTFPYTWRFQQFYANKLNIDENDILNKIFQEVSMAAALGNFIEKIALQNQNKVESL